jgi:hypothetical protein
MACPECYSDEPRVTPIINPESCLTDHLQYVCSMCGRCVCVDLDTQNKYRINFPFKSVEIAKLYLRSAEVIHNGPCEIYGIELANGTKLVKIYRDRQEMEADIKRNPMQSCPNPVPVFESKAYKPHKTAQVRHLTTEEVKRYLKEKYGK